MAVKKEVKEPEYIVVIAQNLELFQERVNECVGKGYAPAGGVAIHQKHTPFEGIIISYYQALVKKAE